MFGTKNRCKRCINEPTATYISSMMRAGVINYRMCDFSSENRWNSDGPRFPTATSKMFKFPNPRLIPQAQNIINVAVLIYNVEKEGGPGWNIFLSKRLKNTRNTKEPREKPMRIPKFLWNS